ncbi:MAG: hypothetical protein HONDAALG_04093 [Gammaproteobacteria bacterium]|nr:hypothetical protein [Gammaproteobacteria bacterium]
MIQKLQNKIEATDTSINALLKDQKFTIDYFQREYRWQEKHIRLLIEDLASTFLKSYDSNHKRSEVSNYQNYYLGPIVFSVNEGKKSIIDGQQRITSITLLLIYLNHLQKNYSEGNRVPINELIFSAKYGEKSFNIDEESRKHSLKALFEIGEYTPLEDDDETVKNITARYNDITQLFPDELCKEETLPFFIDWLIENVVIVAITAYSDENAYTIFETMNDRGLNLTSTEMLKGYILSRITEKSQRNEINDIWKTNIQKLHEYDENTDQTFFQAWFRSKYAVSIRPGKVGSEDQDFELIGSRFHNWFKDNHKEKFNLKSSNDFYQYFKTEFPFFVNLYTKILDAQNKFDSSLENVNFIKHWGIAESLQNALLFAPVMNSDSTELIDKKLNFVAQFIESYTVRRAINYRKFSQASIKYTMFNLIKLIRNNDLENLTINLKEESKNIPETWDAISNFRIHGMNGVFVKHLLCRMTSYLDKIIGKDSTYATYHNPIGKQFEIEHIWANKFEYHRDEFEQENEFSEWRNSIGGLILLPQGTNQSFSSDKYEDKIEHYLKENTYAQSLNPAFYEKNPNFLNSPIIQQLEFTPHPEFKKKDMIDRQNLVRRICENIWSENNFQIIN